MAVENPAAVPETPPQEQGSLQQVEAEQTRKATRRRPKPKVILLGMAVIALIGASIYYLLSRGKESTDDAQIQADVVPLSARVNGPIVKVFIIENQHVKQGEPLFQLDDTDYRARLNEAQANYESAQAQADVADAQVRIAEAAAQGGFSSAQAQVVGSTAGVSGSEAQVAAARAAVSQAQANLNQAALNLRRDQDLFNQRAIPQQVLDNTRTAYLAAKATVAQAQAQLRGAEQASRVAQQRVHEAQGRLNVSRPVEDQIEAARSSARLAHAKADAEQAKFEQARLQLEYTRVVAPQDGVVSNLTAHTGQYVLPGQALANLVPDATYVVANFKETQLNDMRVGQRVVVSVDAYNGRKFEGRIESFSAGTGARFSLLPPDNASGNFVKVVQRVPVRIAWVDLPKDAPPLRAGLNVEVTVHLNEQAHGNPPEQPSGPAVGRRP